MKQALRCSGELLCLCRSESSAAFSLLVPMWTVARVSFCGKRLTKRPEKACQKEALWEHLTSSTSTVLPVFC
jgi:hypothetical protein